jgi:hypothetical protein
MASRFWILQQGWSGRQKPQTHSSFLSDLTTRRPTVASLEKFVLVEIEIFLLVLNVSSGEKV